MKAAPPWVAYRRKTGRGGSGGRWPQPCAGEVSRSKSACGVRGRATMKTQREAVSGQSETVLFARCAPVLGRCSERRAWFRLAWVAVSRGRQACRPNPACSGRGYAPGRPARQNSEKSSPSVALGGTAPPLTLLLGWWWGWRRRRRLAKGSGGHRLGGRNFHSLAWHSTEAVREAEVRAAGSPPGKVEAAGGQNEDGCSARRRP